MSDNELTPLLKAKLIIIDTDHFTDGDALQAFLDLDFSNTDEVYEIADVIGKHRPAIAKTIAKYLNI